MIKDIEKVKNIEYNLNILKVNNFLISESGNIYGHVKEFNKLKKDIKYEAHRVISKESLFILNDNFKIGSATDINGNTYYFDVFEEGYYRIFRVDKFSDKVKEVLENERTFNTNC